MSDIIKQYKHPPVKEAIVTLSLREAISFSTIEALCPNKVFDSNYKLVSEMMEAELGPIQIDKDEDFSPKVSSKRNGYEMRNQAGDVLKIFTTHFSLHLFRPYKGWEYLANEFMNVWGKFEKAIPGLQASEIGARYINELKVPEDGAKELNKYIKLLPNKLDIVHSINHFFIQLQTRDETGDFRGVISETIVPSDASSGFSILLDIAVTCSKLSILVHDQSESLFARIRNYKNTLFEGCITSDMAQLFNTDN